MTHPIKTGLAAAATAALLCLPAMGAHAASSFTVGGVSQASSPSLFQSATPTRTAAISTATALSSPLAIQSQNQTQVASDFLTQTINQSTQSTIQPGTVNDDIQVSVFVQSAPALRNPLSVNLRGDSDLALWNLVASIRAQQTGNSFDLIDTGLTSLQVATAGGPVSPVPLPGAAWLLVMGVLGLTGTRLTGIGPVASDDKNKKPDSRPVAIGPFGSPMPA